MSAWVLPYAGGPSAALGWSHLSGLIAAVIASVCLGLAFGPLFQFDTGAVRSNLNPVFEKVVRSREEGVEEVAGDHRGCPQYPLLRPRANHRRTTSTKRFSVAARG